MQKTTKTKNFEAQGEMRPDETGYSSGFRMKEFDDLDFTDDFMFCKTMVENPDLCKELAELIIGRKIRKMLSVHDQKSIRVTADGKGVRFDVQLEGDDEICDIEMQNSIDKEILPKRSRYYQSVSDVNFLTKGSDYTKLKKSYIIFICRHRPFEDKELHIFTFKNICKEDTTLELGDETVKIFLTPDGTAQDVSGEVKEFMAYMTDHKTESDFAKRLDDAVEKIKSGEGWRIEYTQLREKMEKQYEAGKETGRKTGIEEGRKAGIEEGRKAGIEEGIAMLIGSYTEDGAPESVIEEKLVRRYGLTPEEAKEKIAAYGKQMKE